MTFFETLGWIFVAYLIVSNAIEFFSDPTKRDQKIYEQTAKDVKFNKIK